MKAFTVLLKDATQVLTEKQEELSADLPAS